MGPSFPTFLKSTMVVGVGRADIQLVNADSPDSILRLTSVLSGYGRFLFVVE